MDMNCKQSHLLWWSKTQQSCEVGCHWGLPLGVGNCSPIHSISKTVSRRAEQLTGPSKNPQYQSIRTNLNRSLSHANGGPVSYHIFNLLLDRHNCICPLSPRFPILLDNIIHSISVNRATISTSSVIKRPRSFTKPRIQATFEDCPIEERITT